MNGIKRIAGELIGDGKYALLGICGNGGMAEVWKARAQETGELVAIKFFVPPARADVVESQYTRFLEETKLGKTLNHVNLVPVTDSGIDTNGLPYLVMPFVRGVSLGEYFRDRLGALNGEGSPRESIAAWEDLCDATDQIEDALAYLGAHGIVHRDLKPDNIKINRDVMTGRLSVHLLDLGIAIRANQPVRATLDGLVFGTLKYMAPEQIEELTHPETKEKWGVGSHTDRYALCAILYEVVSGQLPYPEPEEGEGSHAVRMMLRIADLNTSPKSLKELVPHVDRLLAETIHQGLAKRPWERITRAELRNKLRGAYGRISERVGADIAHSTPLPGKLPRASSAPVRTQPMALPPARPPRRNRTWLLAAIGFLSLAAIMVEVRLLLRQQQDATPMPAPVASSVPSVPSAPVVAPAAAPIATTVPPPPQKAKNPQWLYDKAQKLRGLNQCGPAVVLLNEALNQASLDPSLRDSIQREIRACSTP